VPTSGAGSWLGCWAEDKPTVRAVSPRSYIDQTDYVDLQFRPSLRAFTAQRAELLAVLSALAPEGWARTATVTGAGKIRDLGTWW
jgi:hypothetical protein